jgi:hypothetical protein
MSSPAEPVHLSNHERNTLHQIFEHPVSHNIEWRSVISLLETVGTVTQSSAGKLEVALGPEVEFFDQPAHKDIDAQMVVDLRRMLGKAGFAPDAGDR